MDLPPYSLTKLSFLGSGFDMIISCSAYSAVSYYFVSVIASSVCLVDLGVSLYFEQGIAFSAKLIRKTCMSLKSVTEIIGLS